MKRVVIKSFGREITNLVIEERDDLVARGEYIRVKVSATAINRADLLQRRGLYPAPPGVPQDIPGLEFVGHVDQVGEDVTEWQGGERVFGILPGAGYGDQVLTHQRLAVSVPDELSDVEAAAVPEVFMAAHDALVSQGRMGPGDLVLIHAVAGGVGSAAVQLARLWGAQAIGTAGSDAKLASVSEFAVFFPVNYNKDDFQKKIEMEYGSDAVDLILDTIGASNWQKNLALLKHKGRLILLGLLGGHTAETPLATVLTKRLRITGTVLRSRPLEERIIATQAFAREVVPHFRDGRLRPVLDSVYPIDQLHTATARMENKENTGKIVLTLP
jgi:putative PIG3 family NAD(P)H quinone oxidoreductase